MAEDIRDLIDKINEEGIRAAEEKARRIEAMANQRAEEIIASARREAEITVAEATGRIRREDEREKALLAQAGRDLLLSLRNEINAMLGRIIEEDVGATMTPEVLAGLLSAIAEKDETGRSGPIEVLLRKEDLEALESRYFSRLAESARRKIILKPSGEITGGFVISYDSGRSFYDFSDASLAEYIGTYLKPKLNRILQGSLEH